MSEHTTTTDATASVPSDRCPLCGHLWSRHLRVDGCQDLRPGSYPCGCRHAPPSAPPSPPAPAA